jgi:hypothetical protein
MVCSVCSPKVQQRIDTRVSVCVLKSTTRIFMFPVSLLGSYQKMHMVTKWWRKRRHGCIMDLWSGDIEHTWRAEHEDFCFFALRRYAKRDSKHVKSTSMLGVLAASKNGTILDHAAAPGPKFQDLEDMWWRCGEGLRGHVSPLLC